MLRYTWQVQVPRRTLKQWDGGGVMLLCPLISFPFLYLRLLFLSPPPPGCKELVRDSHVQKGPATQSLFSRATHAWIKANLSHSSKNLLIYWYCSANMKTKKIDCTFYSIFFKFFIDVHICLIMCYQWVAWCLKHKLCKILFMLPSVAQKFVTLVHLQTFLQSL